MIDCTVGIFTYQRPEFLNRQLQLFKDLGSDFRIIMLDGSENKNHQSQNRDLSKKYNTEYFNAVDLKERFYHLDKVLDTEFGAYCTDDDFIVPSFYKAGSQFLKEHAQYSVVAGKTYTLHYDQKQLWKGYYLRDYLSIEYDIFRGDFVERITRKDQVYASGCPPTYYGVRRQENIRLFCKHLPSLELYSSMERLENICNLLHGGMKVVDDLMGFRDYSSEPIRQTQRDDPETYISQKDTLVLQEVIKKELSNEIKSKEILDYFASYAWPLPLRPLQINGNPEGLGGWKREVESVFNLYFAHHFHAFDRNTTRSMRRALMLKTSVADLHFIESKTLISVLYHSFLRIVIFFLVGTLNTFKSIIRKIIPVKVWNFTKRILGRH